MSRRPYYLVASLPTLVIGEPPPFTGEDLLVRIQHLLSDGERREVRLALDGRERDSAHPFLVEWVRADTQMRNAIARVRAGKLAAEPRGYLREHEGFDLGLEKSVTDAYARPNPLERESALDHCRWQILDTMVQKDPFGFGAVLAYAIRLRMVARWAGLQEPAGRARMEELLGGIASAASQAS